VVSYIATKIVNGYGKEPEITSLLQHFTISVIPVLNIDGYIYTHTNNRMWRKNRQPNQFFCVGTDPNRNWDFKWGSGGASSNPCSEAYQGPKAFSAPESYRMAQYFKKRKGKVISYIDFHSYSQLWMFPYGALCNKRAPDYDKLDKAAKSAVRALKAIHGTSFAAGPICEIIYQASGSSVDWTYSKANVTYSMAVELRDKGQYGFLLPPSEIIPSGEETLAAFLAMANTISELEGVRF
jgi:murein tripeptide amidase MpaA